MSDLRRAVTGLSRPAIRERAWLVRSKFGFGDQPYLPIIQLLEWGIPLAIPNFELQVLPESEMGQKHGETYPDEHVICLREDVYERALEGEGRDRATAAHELGHLLLHSGVGHARVMPGTAIPVFADPEWQAKAFAGELLVSYKHLAECHTPAAAAKLFGVSLDAAEYQWQKFRESGLLR